MTHTAAILRNILVLGCLAGWTTLAMAQTPPIESSAWVLSSLPGRTLVAGTSMTLLFEGNHLSGSDGCNRYTAPYTASGTSLQLGARAASTQMACPEAVMAQAAAFRNALQQTRSYRIDGGRLDLLGAGGALLATFAPQPQTLAGTSWQVTGYNNGRQAVVNVLNGTTLTLTFGADGRVNGSSGCNTYTGPYTAQGASLTFGATATTRRMCGSPERIMEQEQQFLQALGTVATARFEGDRLELRTATGSLAASLARDTGR